jgi:transcriptional repressor NrdR
VLECQKTTWDGGEMKCPRCGGSESKVVDSRSIGEGIRRRRECLGCKTRFTSYERIQSKSVFVIKKDGRREEFNREKLLSGIRKSCEKRPLPTGTIDKLVDNIEADVYNLGKNEIQTSFIGNKVMEKLEEIDHIAYIRFASIYHDFSDITTLKQAVDELLETKIEAPLAGQLFLFTPTATKNNGKIRTKTK